MNTRRHSIGVTLTELLVVVAVVGVLATLAVPSFRSLVESQRVKNAGFEMFSLLSLARSEAIKRNANVTITPSFNAEGEVGFTVTAADGEVIRTKSALKGVVVTVAPSGTTEVVYRRTGRATATPTFQVDVSATPTANVRCIEIELSGMPRSSKGVCS
jgi:type IV fimbrial biogenesis protein FimT